MDWDDLKVALAVARTGSLNRAADILRVNQSTVGRRLTELEAALGATLFRRSRHGLTATDAGELLVAKAAEIERRAGQIMDQVAQAEGSATGVVRLAANQWMIDRLIAGGLGQLIARNPGLSIRTLAAQARVSLWRGEPGVGLWFEQQALEGAFGIKLGSVPYAVYRAADADPVAWVAFFDEEAPALEVWRRIEALRPADEPLRLTAMDAGTLCEAVAAGIGRGLLPVCLGEADSRLVRVTKGAPDFERALHLHAHPDTLGSPRLQVLITWLRENFDRILRGGDSSPDAR